MKQKSWFNETTFELIIETWKPRRRLKTVLTIRCFILSSASKMVISSSWILLRSSGREGRALYRASAWLSWWFSSAICRRNSSICRVSRWINGRDLPSSDYCSLLLWVQTYFTTFWPVSLTSFWCLKLSSSTSFENFWCTPFSSLEWIAFNFFSRFLKNVSVGQAFWSCLRTPN